MATVNFIGTVKSNEMSTVPVRGTDRKVTHVIFVETIRGHETYFRLTSWDERAYNAHNQLTVGSKFEVTSEFFVSPYRNNSGETLYSLELVRPQVTPLHTPIPSASVPPIVYADPSTAPCFPDPEPYDDENEPTLPW